MKTSEIFKQAKKILWKGGHNQRAGKDKFICCAIDKLDIPQDERTRAERLIHSYLGGYSTFEIWLAREHGLDSYHMPEKVQQTRHAWLAHLIEHYESIGD